MKTTLTRLLTVLLALSMLAALPGMLISCGNGDSGTVTTTTTTASGAGDVITPGTEDAYDANGYLKDSLDPSLSFAGKTINVLYWEDQEHEEFQSDSITGDLVGDAIYTRNQAVEERLGITFNFIPTKGNASNIAAYTTVVNNSVNAGDRAYNIVAAHSMTMGNVASKALLYNLTDCDYLDWEKPWWPAGLIDQATINGKLYFCSGDISANLIYMMYVTFFNKDLLNDFRLEDPYKLVDEGKWTIDKMFEMCSGVYNDLNSNGQKDIGDLYGQYTYTLHLDAFLTGSNIIMVNTNGEELSFSPEFLGEKTLGLQEKVRNFFMNTSDGYLLTVNSSVHQYFSQGLSLFWNDRCRQAITFSDKDISYGIIPVPKYDEAQKNHVTVIGNPFTPYGIPCDASEEDANMAAAVLECMASESYRNVSPALYETALKLKYSQDDVASRMFDIAKSTVAFDLGRIFSSALGSPAGKWQSAISGNVSWATLVKANSKVWTKQLSNLLAAFK